MKPKPSTEKNSTSSVNLTNKVKIHNNLYKGTKLNFQLKSEIIERWEMETELKCMICWTMIKLGENVSRCTSCNNKFHEEHWRQWIITKEKCPVCQIKVLR